jgi:hypothetical protein
VSERSPIPNLPPISGVQDPATRAYLEALTQAWLVRNGQTRETDEKFLTVKDLKEGFAYATRGSGGVLGGAGAGEGGGLVGPIIQSLSDAIMQSRLWRLLGERIQKIEMPEWFQNRFGAEIKTEQIRLESATQSLAQQVTTVTAALGSSVAGVRTEITAVANATNALADSTTTAIAQTNQNVGLVQQQVTAVSSTANATASQVTQLQTTVGNATTMAQQAFDLAQSVDGQVDGSWTVKFDSNGYVTGAGLGLQGRNGSYSSEFIVRADRFSIGTPVNPSAQWDADVPFIVTTTPTTSGGVTYPPGTWIKAAMIADASIDNAKIGNVLQSSNYSAGAAGWVIRKSGSPMAEFNGDVVINGNITSASLRQGVTNAAQTGEASFYNEYLYIQQLSVTVTHNLGRPAVITLWNTGYTAAYTDGGGEGSSTVYFSANAHITTNTNTSFTIETPNMSSYHHASGNPLVVSYSYI